MRLALALLLVASPASAERGLELLPLVGGSAPQTFSSITFHWGWSDPHYDRGDTDDYEPYPGSFTYGVVLAWEHDPSALPDLRSHEKVCFLSTQFVTPELAIVGVGRRAMALAGLRLEAANEYGKDQAIRMWIAPRVGVLEGATSPVVGLDYTTLFHFTRHANFGLVMGLNFWREPDVSCRTCLERVQPGASRSRTSGSAIDRSSPEWWIAPYGGFTYSVRL